MTVEQVALIGLAILLGYYLATWFRVGIDPAKGAIVPRYRPPDGVSPAAARYLVQMKYDARCLAATIVHLGVHGWLTLNENKEVYRARRGDSTNASSLTREEVRLAGTLFGKRKRLRFKSVNRGIITGLLETHRKALERAYESTHFVTNRTHWLVGIAILVGIGAAIIGVAEQPAEVAMLGSWLGVWSVALIALGRLVTRAWAFALSGAPPALSVPAALGATLFAVPFFVAEGYVALELAGVTSPATVAMFIAMAFALLTFYHLLKAPTLLGRKTLDELEGYRLYLSATGAHRRGQMHIPTLTPEVYETHLAYAIALGVEREWSGEFTRGQDPETRIPASDHWFQSRWDSTLETTVYSGKIGSSLTGAIESAAARQKNDTRLGRTRHRPGRSP